MDIDKLKGSWKKYTSRLSAEDHKEDDLGRILQIRSQSSLRKLRRNFFIEAGLNVLIVPFILLFLISGEFVETPFKWYFSSFIVLVLIVFLVYLYRSYMKIYRYERYDLKLRDKLKDQIQSLGKFIRMYYQFLYYSYFIVLVVGLLLDLPSDSLLILKRLGFGFGLGIAVFFIILRPFARVYISKLYGNHLESLKRCLEELDENETNYK